MPNPAPPQGVPVQCPAWRHLSGLQTARRRVLPADELAHEIFDNFTSFLRRNIASSIAKTAVVAVVLTTPY